MFAHGTTTAEAKTGYGLQTGTELRMLDSILKLNEEGRSNWRRLSWARMPSPRI